MKPRRSLRRGAVRGGLLATPGAAPMRGDRGVVNCFRLNSQNQGAFMFIQLKRDYLGQKAGARLDVEETVAQSLVTQEIAEPVEGDPLAPVVQRSMESLLATLTKNVGSA